MKIDLLMRPTLYTILFRAMFRGTRISAFFVVTLWFCNAVFAIADEPFEMPVGTLRLVSGDVIKGTFDKSTSIPKESLQAPSDLSSLVVFWNCPSFSKPLEIPWSATDSIVLRRSGGMVSDREQERFVIEYWTGECITGEIESLDEHTLTIHSDRFGSHTIPTKDIRSVLRVVEDLEKEPGFLAPDHWKQTIPPEREGVERRWIDKVGVLQTDTSGTSIVQNVFVPDVNALEIDVAWSHSSPNWTLTLGSPRKLELHVRKIEHRDALSVTLLFEENKDADIETAILPFENMESIRLRILSDYLRGRFALQHRGKTIAEIHGKEKQSSNGNQDLTLTNVAQGGLSLREVRISRSVFSLSESDSESSSGNSELPSHAPKIILFNTEDYTGSPTDFQSENRTFSLAGNAASLGRIAISSVERIEFPRRSKGVGATPLSHVAESNLIEHGICFVELQNGNRYSCHRFQQTGEELELIGTAVGQNLRCALSEVTSIYIQRVPVASTFPEEQPPPIPRTRSRLITPDVISTGRMVNTPIHRPDAKIDASPGEKQATEIAPIFFWLPEGMHRPAPLNGNVDGSIEITRLLFPKEDAAKTLHARVAEARMEIYGRPLKMGEPAIYLKSGDAIPGRLDAIQDGYAEIASTYFGNVKIAADEIRGYRFLSYSGFNATDAKILGRMLTVPRMSKKEPPTHLLISRDGDAIRGRLVEADQDSMVFHVRGVDQRIWNKNVAELIWLSPEDTNAIVESPTDPSTASNAPKGRMERNTPIDSGNALTTGNMACQIVMEHGARWQVIPQSVQDGTLLGKHPLLGEFKVPVEECVRILFGSEIQESSQNSHFARWKLRNAPDPKFVAQEKERADIAAGKSKWIGQAAPEIQLEKLAGETFVLSKHRGKVIVVDFWASWCGPCMKGLPEVAGVVSSFPTHNVELVAINVAEQQQLVFATAATLGIQDSVAIDPEGFVAKLYGAQAIPYTVVIDPQGVIQNVFIGANPDTATRLREAIAAALENASPLVPTLDQEPPAASENR